VSQTKIDRDPKEMVFFDIGKIDGEAFQVDGVQLFRLWGRGLRRFALMQIKPSAAARDYQCKDSDENQDKAVGFLCFLRFFVSCCRFFPHSDNMQSNSRAEVEIIFPIRDGSFPNVGKSKKFKGLGTL
jgi:hypothetical protein